MHLNDFNQEKKENELLGQILRNWFWLKFMKLTNEQVSLVHCFFHLGFWFWTIESNCSYHHCSSFLSQINTLLLEDSFLGECIPQDKGQTKAYHSSDDNRVPPLPQVDLLHEVVHQRKPGKKISLHQGSLFLCLIWIEWSNQTKNYQLELSITIKPKKADFNPTMQFSKALVTSIGFT